MTGALGKKRTTSEYLERLKRLRLKLSQKENKTSKSQLTVKQKFDGKRLSHLFVAGRLT